MKLGRNIACLKRNGHWFYFRWDDENEAKMLFQAYLQAVDPGCAFDLIGLAILSVEIKMMPEQGISESIYLNLPEIQDGNDSP